jgi:DNA mismatch endonuclease (patch repair protein)
MKRRIVNRVDPLSPKQRSARMALVRSKKNRSTEMRVAAQLIGRGLSGWSRNPPDIPGCPDFCFAEERVAVFVDGCFWHGCLRCRRNLPQARREFWRNKIETNRTRDRKVNALLKAKGFTVVRIWEHALKDGLWLRRLSSVLHDADGDRS